jgi:hypothetical protein
MNAAGDACAALDAGRLAAPLHRLATRTTRAVSAEGLVPAAAALRVFVQHSSPTNFLVATRSLRAAVRQQKLARLASVAAPRRAAEHLSAIGELAGLSAEQHALLATLPANAATTRRFAVIAQLLTAHRLLSASAEATQQDLQEHLGQPAPRASSAGRRRR